MKKINKAAIINFFEGSGARRIAFVVSGIQLIVIAWMLAGSIWLFLDHPELALRASPPITEEDANRQVSEQDIQLLAQRSHFGEHQAAPLELDKKDETTPFRKEPSQPLVLNLLGIVFSPNAQLARAVIQEQGKEDGVFAIGAQIADQATVEKITEKAVYLVLKDGTRQIFSLPDDTTNLTQGAQPNAASSSDVAIETDKPLIAPTPYSLGGLREELVTNPGRIVEYIRFAPVSRGRQFIGFRVSPGRNGDIFQQIGLRNGDIITAVDQVPMDNPQRGFEVVQKIASAQQIDLTISRGGSERNVSIKF